MQRAGALLAFSRADVSAVPFGSPVSQTGCIIFDPDVDYLAKPLGSLTGINVVLGVDRNSKTQSGVRHGCLNACLNTRFSVPGLTRSLRYSRHQFGRLTVSSVVVILVCPIFRLNNLVPLEFAHPASLPLGIIDCSGDHRLLDGTGFGLALKDVPSGSFIGMNCTESAITYLPDVPSVEILTQPLFPLAK